MKTKPRCYNCKFAGEQFKIKELTHLHCEDPKKYTQEKHDNDEFCAWDTLRVFDDICSNHELAEPKQLIIGDVSGSYSVNDMEDAYDKGFKDAMVKYRE